MTTVYYFNSFVPEALIAACGCVPKHPDGVFETNHCVQTEGMCPFTQSRLEALLSRDKSESFISVFTTSCDQMRRAYDVYCEHCRQPAFLLNVPSTNTPNTRNYYRQELRRLCEFLCRQSGKAFEPKQLYSLKRHQTACNEHSLKVAVIGETVAVSVQQQLADILNGFHIEVELNITDNELAGHFLQLEPEQTKDDSFGAFADAFFQLPAIWKRPNDAFYNRLSEEIEDNSIKGIIVFRYIFCDVWHSGAFEMKKRLDVPVLQVDLDDSAVLSASAISRIQAFAEMLAS